MSYICVWFMDKDSFSCQVPLCFFQRKWLFPEMIESSNFWRWLLFEMFSLGLLRNQFDFSEIHYEHENGMLS